jgi:hypothetical protein
MKYALHGDQHVAVVVVDGPQIQSLSSKNCTTTLPAFGRLSVSIKE